MKTMKKYLCIGAVAVTLAMTGIIVQTQAAPVAAKVDPAAALALARKSGCLACHSVDRKIVGPAWKDVAAKYKGNLGIEASLIDKVKKGGAGVWGNTPMPANSPHVSDADIKTLVDFVLSLK